VDVIWDLCLVPGSAGASWARYRYSTACRSRYVSPIHPCRPASVDALRGARGGARTARWHRPGCSASRPPSSARAGLR